MQIDAIFENNKNWIAGKKEVDPDYFKKLAEGQTPEVLYIGCADSRVTAEEMMGAEPGELFVHRNIANVVDNTDLSSMSVINYAVVHLGVKHVVVCGHYECGGVKAAMVPKDLGILNPWLRNIRDVYRLHAAELNAIEDEETRYRRLVELNVQEQCVNVMKAPEVQLGINAGKLTIHGWVMEVSSGKLIDLNIDFQSILDHIQEIYRLE